MKIIRWAAVAALTLISLMNVGTVTGGNGLPVAVIVLAVVLGLLGIAAAVGLVRNTVWGRPAALAVAAVNVVSAIIGLAAGSDGAVIGLVVSAVALALSFFTASAALSRPQSETSMI